MYALLNKKFKNLALTAGILFVVTGLGGIAPGANPQTFHIGSMVWDASIPFYANFIKGQKEAAAKYGIDLDFQNGDSKLETQVSVVEQFLSEKKNLIIVTPGDAEGIVPVIKQAEQAGVPVIAANNNVGYGGNIVTFVGSSNYEFGKLQGKLLVDAIGTSGNVAYLLGALGTDPQVNREKGMTDFLKSYPDIHIIAKQTANWNASQALSVTQDWLSKYPSGTINAIVDQGPEGISGAQNAAQTGRSDVKFVLGNYPETIRKAIEDGIVYGTIIEDPYHQGYTSVEYAYYWLTGQKDKVDRPQHYMPNPVITKANAASVPPEM
jgi:ABC-type sugar transport system substrate-binding protein